MSRKLRSACQHCGAMSTLTVTMPASMEGQQLTMTSCLRCERRQWTTSAGSVSMQDVLRNLSGRRDFALTPTARPTRRSARQRGCAAG